MIRLPPTGISLSDSDINFHLQQINVYHGLLRQGFKRSEILRYFNEHQAAQRALSGPCDSLGSPSLTTVELAARSHIYPDNQTETEEAVYPNGQEAEAEADEAPSLTSTHPHFNPQAHRHAPRQSSLLRFAQAVSSSSPTGQAESASDADSENQLETPERQLSNLISRLDLGLPTDVGSCAKTAHSIPPRWAEAEPFVPASQRESTTRSSMGNRTRDIPLHRDTLSDDTVRRADPAPVELISSSMPSSPPTLSIAHQEEPASSPVALSPNPPSMPPASARAVRPEYRGFDPSSFHVYNDGLPVHSQPQTPADLSRHLVITEEDAAYTAPPGALHTVSPTRRSRLTVVQRDMQAGDQSPVALAMDSRERRTRELMRGVRAERMRLQRQLQHDREVIAQGLDGGDEGPDRDNPGAITDPELWRDDFEGDRVGDENWEGQ